MAFVDVVNKVVQLAKAWGAEDEQLKKKHGVEDGLRVGSPEGFAYMAAPRPAQGALKAYLESLDEATVLKLQAVMYGGRDRNPDFRDLKDQVSDGKEDAIETMISKKPLGDYLAEGLVLAQRNFVDLEGDI